MDNRATWEERVKSWKASGLTSEAYCADKPFTAGGLRYWASLLRQTKPQARRAKPASIALARVVPVQTDGSARRMATSAEATTRSASPDGHADALVVEFGSAKVVVRPGFDRSTLASLLDVLQHHGGRR